MPKHLLYCGTALLIAGAHFANPPLLWVGGFLILLVIANIVYQVWATS